MKYMRVKKPVAPAKYVERWEVIWEYQQTLYGSYPLHRSLASALREAQKVGGRNDDYNGRLERVEIKRLKVAV